MTRQLNPISYDREAQSLSDPNGDWVNDIYDEMVAGTFFTAEEEGERAVEKLEILLKIGLAFQLPKMWDGLLKEAQDSAQKTGSKQLARKLIEATARYETMLTATR